MGTLIRNTAELRSFNTKRVIDYARCHGAVTQKTLTEALDLSFATVANICNQLIIDGILQETGTDSSSGGRMPKLLSLVDSSRLTICLYLLRSDVYDISIADLAGRELSAQYVRTAGKLSVGDLIGRLNSVSGDMLSAMGRSRESVLGVAVAAPGIFDAETGLIVNSTDPLFENHPLKSALEQQFKLPVYVENESNLLAIAASRADDEGRSLNDLVYLYVGDGVGVGIISNGTLVTGSRGFGGEIEHIPIGERDFGCYCGNTGCVEPELIESGFLRKWSEAIGKSADELSWADFLATVNEGRPDGIAVVEENGRLIGKLLSILVNIFDPEVVYVGGIVEDFFAAIRPSIASELAARMVAHNLRTVPIVCDADYRSMMLKGCTELVFNEWRA